MTRAACTARTGFTAVEILVVTATMMVLTAIALPYIGESLQRSRVNEATNIVNFTCSEARRLAQSEQGLYDQIEAGSTPIVPYGVKVAAATGSERGYAVLMGWQPGSTTPQEIGERRYFAHNVTFANATVGLGTAGETTVTGEVTIHFQYRTGFFGTALAADGRVVPATAPLVLRVASAEHVGGDQTEGVEADGIVNATTFFDQLGVTHDQ